MNSRYVTYSWSLLSYQDSITSAIRNGTNAVVSALSSVIQTIANAIVTVRVAFIKCGQIETSISHHYLLFTGNQDDLRRNY
jgi:hypothetical protein